MMILTEDVNWCPVALEDALVTLTPLQGADFDRLFEVASDPEIWAQHPVRNRYEKEVFEKYFEKLLTSVSPFLIFDKTTGKLIGATCYYDFKPQESSIAIGYTFLAKATWGGDYNRACKNLLLDYAFERVQKVYFHIGATNLRSQKAISKLGAYKFRDMDFEGQPYCEYLIDKENWKVRKD